MRVDDENGAAEMKAIVECWLLICAKKMEIDWWTDLRSGSKELEKSYLDEKEQDSHYDLIISRSSAERETYTNMKVNVRAEMVNVSQKNQRDAQVVTNARCVLEARRGGNASLENG